MADQISKLLEQKEHEIMNEVVSNAKKIAVQEMKLFEFELLCSVMASAKEKKEITAWVDQKRKKDWEIALKKANGDTKKAMSILKKG